jgi:hypothetical protein
MWVREQGELRLQSLLLKLAAHVDAILLEEPAALLRAGEWGVAFECLCDKLYEFAIPLYSREVADIEFIGGLTANPRHAWRLIASGF